VLPQITVTSDTPLMTIVPPAKQKRKAVPRPLTLQKFFVDVCSRL